MDNLDILENDALKEKEDNINKIKSFLNNLLVSVCGKHALEVEIRLNTAYNLKEEISLDSFILDKDGKEIFGSGLDISYVLDYTRKDKVKKLKLNQGSIGLISKEENIGKYYADILKGQLWLNEDKLVELFNSLNWSKYLNYKEEKNKLELENWKKYQAKVEYLENKLKNNLIINKEYKCSRYVNGEDKVMGIFKLYKITSTRFYFENKNTLEKYYFSKEGFLEVNAKYLIQEDKEDINENELYFGSYLNKLYKC